jgi:hypothetical protein
VDVATITATYIVACIVVVDDVIIVVDANHPGVVEDHRVCSTRFSLRITMLIRI